ncbi:MAG: LCP family protein, partial [Actinomycetota bacterium]|nr:LCP family protein [Actinomycetota bacterium]
MPASRGPVSDESADDRHSSGPITVTDLLVKAGQAPLETPGRRIAARQAIFEVHRHRVRRFFAVLLTFLLALLASVAAYYVGLFFYLDRTVERVDALALDSPGIVSPQAQDGADNFLIVGSRRVGSDRHVTSALIAHLTPQRNGAVLISLPLTALIDVPACPRGQGERPAEPYGGSLASSFDTGGAGCLVRSVQQMSGMRIDHYIQSDLGRLPGMVDALGGVPVCLPTAVSAGQMIAPAGESVLDADQVSSLLADIDATEDPTGQRATDRQRLLLASTLREALRLQNLANPIVLTRFVNQAANALTLDPATTMGELKDLGDKLGQFTAGDTVQASVPLQAVAYQPNGSEDSYALIDDVASRGLFSAIINNAGLPDMPASVPSAEATGPLVTADPALPTETVGSPP